jgi:NAD-dependent deacetylase
MARSDSTRADAPQFEFDEALDAEIERAGRIVADARSVVALTGAGLSVESGIPPFRGPGGLWTRYGEPPMDGYQRFLRDPRKAWQETLSPREPWAKALRETLAAAKPNAAHRAFAELERLGRCDWLITQNIDDLHRQAGTRNLLEIHGNYQLLRCLECGRRYERTEVGIDPERLPPHCPDCGGIVKGDTVQFGEPIPPDVLRGCFAAVAGADCMIVAGTSATVYPSADFPYEVLRRRGSVVEVNPYETELTTAATVSLRGPGAAVSERLLRCVARLAHGSRS